MAAVARLAGGDLDRALVLGLAMTLLQLGIGTMNDVVDAPSDAGRKLGKPIPAGIVPAQAAVVVAVGCFGAGLVLGAIAGPAIAALSVVVVAIGLTYDLRLKGTAWSWLAFAIGIPILPVYGWLGATGVLHPAFWVLVPAAVAGGAALAIANSLVDVERDMAAGQTSIAARLGRRRASRVGLMLLVAVQVADGISILAAGGSGFASSMSQGAAFGAVVAAIVPVDRPELAERAWQAQAILLAVTAIGWIAAVLAV